MNDLYKLEVKLTADTLERMREILDSEEPFKYAMATGMLSARISGLMNVMRIIENDPDVLHEFDRCSRAMQ